MQGWNPEGGGGGGEARDSLDAVSTAQWTDISRKRNFKPNLLPGCLDNLQNAHADTMPNPVAWPTYNIGPAKTCVQAWACRANESVYVLGSRCSPKLALISTSVRLRVRKCMLYFVAFPKEIWVAGRPCQWSLFQG